MKKIMALLLALVMVIALAGCARGNPEVKPSDDPSAGADDGAQKESGKYTLMIGHVYTSDSLEHAQMEKIKELVEKKTDGRCEVTIYSDELLGDEQSIAEQCVTGACDVGASEGSVWATVTDKPEFAVFGLPFQYSNADACQKVTKELIRPELNKIAEGTGLYVLGNVYSGFRHMMTVKKPITALEDLKGLKMRVPNATIYVQLFKCLGANPTTTAFSETYQALQQGVVEGSECDLTNIVQMNWHEVNNYMAYTYHLAAMNIICINQDKWDSYPEDIQEAIQEAVMESEEYCFEIRASADAEFVGAIKDEGVQINELAPEELQRMREACQPIYDEFEGYGLGDLLSKIDSYN